MTRLPSSSKFCSDFTSLLTTPPLRTSPYDRQQDHKRTLDEYRIVQITYKLPTYKTLASHTRKTSRPPVKLDERTPGQSEQDLESPLEPIIGGNTTYVALLGVPTTGHVHLMLSVQLLEAGLALAEDGTPSLSTQMGFIVDLPPSTAE